jgi:hypothetical protein
MSTWAFRVIEQESNQGHKYYQIFECHFNNAGRLVAIGETPEEPFGENIGELVGTLGYMVHACARPPLRMKDIEASWKGDHPPIYADGQPVEGEPDETLEEIMGQRGCTLQEFMEKHNITLPDRIEDLPPVSVLKWVVEVPKDQSETEEPS